MGPREHIRAIVSGIDWWPETGTLPDPITAQPKLSRNVILAFHNVMRS